MISTDSLFLLERHLAEGRTKSPDDINRIRKALKQVYELDEYKRWLKEGQYGKSVALKGRFSLPSTFGTDLGDDKWLLEDLDLVSGALLEVKVDSHGEDELHITDGSWGDRRFRVYPFSDESKLICDYFHAHRSSDVSEVLIDPACGCGHHGLMLHSIPAKVSLDINPRALTYCRINSILGGMPQMLVGLNDLREGMPDILNKLAANSALVAINMPFAIFPKSKGLPGTLAQDGGDRGAQLTFAALDAVSKLSKSANMLKQIRCLVLFYSLGNAGKGEWEVVERAKRIFGSENVKSEIFTNETMWRVNGRKEQPNPMPVDSLKRKSECRHTFEEDEADSARDGYVALQEMFKSNGFTHLGYGLLDIRCKTT